MRILFLTHYAWPHVGGVERHVCGVTKNLKLRTNNKITIITEQYDKDLKETEIKDGVKIIRFKFPHIKYLGLLCIWFWLFKNRSLIKQSDIIHCHDVFIWYLPFRFVYPKKVVYTTFHGWEGIWPIPWKNILYKRIANRLSWGSIAVGRYIEKYYGIKANKIVYGGTDTPRESPFEHSRGARGIVWVGRLERDTGLPQFLEWLMVNDQGLRVDFVGDGQLRSECEKYGMVRGFTDPKPFLKRAKICVPGGYLSYIEAKQADCKIMTFHNNPLKKDYWDEIKRVKRVPTWDEVADEYISLYHGFK